jgi:hypothetical protein
MPSPPLSFSLFFLRATTLRSCGYWTRKVVRVEGKKNRTATPIGKGEVVL